jgi:soluble lytic murein transglycosylase-like protein
LVIGISLVLSGAALAAGGGDASVRTTSVVRINRRTGRLVRFVVPAALPGSPSKQVPDFVQRAAELQQLDPLLVHSVIQAESAYNPFAISPKGAKGLMQLMPSTARRFGVSNSFDVFDNIQGGVRYLRYLMDLFGNTRLAVAAYNAGEQAVIKYGGVPPFPETRNYVRTVNSAYEGSKRTDVIEAPGVEELAEPSEPAVRPIEQFVDSEGNLHIRTR